MEGTMAVVTPVGYDFTPRYWQQCNGQLLSISTNQALFALLGTTYGGNGIQTFALPDLRGRVPVGAGTSPAFGYMALGQSSGSETVTLTMNNIPPHNHNGSVNITMRGGNSPDIDNPTAAYPGDITNGYAAASTAGTAMTAPVYSNTVIGQAGSSMPVEILTPYLAVNYVICVQGIFPSRN